MQEYDRRVKIWKKILFFLVLILLLSFGLWGRDSGKTTSAFATTTNLLSDGVEKTVNVYFPTGVSVSGMNTKTREEIIIEGNAVTYIWHSNYGKQDDHGKTIVTILPVVIKEP